MARTKEAPNVLLAPPWRTKSRPAFFRGAITPAKVPVVCPSATGTLPEPARWTRSYGAKGLDVSTPPGSYVTYFDVRVVLDPADSIAVFGEAALPGLLEVLPRFLE